AVSVREGPFAAPQPRFHVAQIAETLRNRRLRLANLGYLGHMWELYSMWAWIAMIFAIGASVGQNASSNGRTEMLSALAIGIGCLGCVWAGRVADRLAGDRVAGRARVTIIAMTVSGACCLAAAFTFEHFYALVAVAVIWGVAVIADSA